MPAPTIVSFSTAADQTGSTFSVTAPTSITNGNLLIAFEACTSGTPSEPTGWNTVVGTPVDFSIAATLNFFWKVASSEPGSYTFNGGGGMVSSTVYILNISGAVNTGPDDFEGNSGMSGTATATGFSTIVNNELVLCVYAVVPTATMTLSGSLTDLGQVGTAMTLDVGWLDQATIGNPGNITASLNPTTNSWGTIQTHISPTGGGGSNIVDDEAGVNYVFRTIW